MNIQDFIANFKNHPILFIGTGFSLRYLENSYTWDGLLSHICNEVTDNTEIFLDIKSKYQNTDNTFNYEKIATCVEDLFNKHLSEDRNGKFKNINDSFYDNMRNDNNISRFKIYISTLFTDLVYLKSHETELTALKKVRKNIGSIITTNYDNLIEEIFQFVPLIGNDILLSNPYGSVYKIHGCVTKPDKIIINENDYADFKQKYELIRAQLLSLFIHNPIIFIGYSISDENIKSLLKTIFTYVTPNSDIAHKIKSNFLLVEYENGSTNTIVTDHDIVLANNVTIRVNKLKTNNFTSLYDALSSIDLPISAMDIRKVQNIVRDIYEGGNIQVKIVNDIDTLLNSEKILAIGNVNRISYEYQTTGEMMANYFNIIEEDNSQLLSLIDKHAIQKEQFFPIFAFSQINNNISSSTNLKIQQKNKLKSIFDSTPIVAQKKFNTIKEIEDDPTISSVNICRAIVYSMLSGFLNSEDIKNFLINYEQKQSTDYRRILCAFDFINYSGEDKI